MCRECWEYRQRLVCGHEPACGEEPAAEFAARGESDGVEAEGWVAEGTGFERGVAEGVASEVVAEADAATSCVVAVASCTRGWGAGSGRGV